MNKYTEMELNEWMNNIHSAIDDSVSSRLPRFWDEDSITEKILCTLTSQYPRVKIKCNAPLYKVSWDAFKFSGKPENVAGDIAVLVKFTFKNNVQKEGVTFLEAKKAYKKSSVFENLSLEQLSRHLKFTHAHRTLLYDFSPTSQHLGNLEFQQFCGVCNFETNTTYASTLLSEHTISINDNTRNLHSYSLPLSYILTSRYLHGFELDYSEKPVKLAKGFINDEEKGGVKFLLVAHVSLSEQENAEASSISINHDKFTRLVASD